MRKVAFILSIFAVLFIAPAVGAQGGSDENFQRGEVVTVAKGETVQGDFFAFGETVEISGTVNGDVYTAGGQVSVDGTVNGDLLAAGGTISISGRVDQDVRAAGGQLTISGEVGGNITLGAGNVELTEDAKVGGSILAGVGNLRLASPVGGSVRLGAGNVNISNKIDGNVNVAAEDIRIASNAKIGGYLTYWSDKDASIDENAEVVGEVTKKAPADVSKSSENFFGAFAGFSLFGALVSLVSTFIVGLILIRFFPVFNKNVVANLTKTPWISLGAGFLALILVPIAAFILMITIVGIPLGLILMVLYVVALYLARIFVIYWIGSTIFARMGGKTHELWALIVGLIVYYLITLIPVLGGLVTFSVLLFGLGAAILAERDLYTTARKKDIV